VYELVLDLKETSRPVTVATLLCGGHASGELWAASPVEICNTGWGGAPSSAQGAAGAMQKAESTGSDMPGSVDASVLENRSEVDTASTSSARRAAESHSLGQLFVTFGDDGVLRLWDAVAHTTLVCFVVRGKDDAPLGGRAVVARAIVSSTVRDDGESAQKLSEEDVDSNGEVVNGQKDGAHNSHGVIEVVACLADGSIAVFRVDGSEGTAVPSAFSFLDDHCSLTTIAH
jgi:hypothetical protein